MSDFSNHMCYLKIDVTPIILKSISYFALLTILIFEKFKRPSGVKSGVPSSMKLKSVKYKPKYGMQGGSHLWRASLSTLNLPSDDTTLCNLAIVWRVCKK